MHKLVMKRCHLYFVAFDRFISSFTNLSRLDAEDLQPGRIFFPYVYFNVIALIIVLDVEEFKALNVL